MCRKLDVDSSSRFSFRARTETHTVTDATDHPMPRIGYAGMGLIERGSCVTDLARELY